MGNDTGQWRAAIGSYCVGPRRKQERSQPENRQYPYYCGVDTDPEEVTKAINQLHRFQLLAVYLLPADLSERRQFFNCLVCRLLLLLSGIEENPGPAGTTNNADEQGRQGASRSGRGAEKRQSSSKSITDFFQKKSKTATSTTDPPAAAQCDGSGSADEVTGASSLTSAAGADQAPGIPSVEASSSTSSQVLPEPQVAYKYDIGSYVNVGPVDDFTKLQLIDNPWTPDAHYKFPYSVHMKGGKEVKQYASLKHINSYEWLEFSHAHGGYYCKYCVVFAKDSSTRDKAGNSLGAFVKSPVTQFSKVSGQTGLFVHHLNTSYHKASLLAASDFKKTYKDPNLVVLNQLDSQRASQVADNRRRLRPIVQTVILCGRQNIPLRGHRDDGRLDIQEEASKSIVSHNDGNFRALLRYRIAGGDKHLAHHLTTSSSTATYIGKNTQNDLINACGDEVASILCARIRKAKWFSIIFDETTDVSRKEQMSVSIRYLHGKQIREDFLTFVDCYASMRPEDILSGGEKKLTGVALAHIVVDICKKFGLDLNYLVGIGTDNCSVMASDTKGAVQEIQKVAPLALRCPCLNHSLNNSLKQSNTIISCKSSIAKIKEVIAFSNASAKLSEVFKKHLGRSFCGLCETRWIEKHDGVLQFRMALPKICDALEEISGWSSETASHAHSLKTSLMNSEFIVTTFALSDILAVTRPLSLLLQSKTLDYVTASDAVKDVITLLQKKRNAAESEFGLLFLDATAEADALGVDITAPRTAPRQSYRANTPASTPEEYYRRTVYIPLLDITLRDIRDRLSQDVLESFDLRILMPNQMQFNNNEAAGIIDSNTKAKLHKLLVRYTSALDPAAGLQLDAEFSLWMEKWRRADTASIPNTVLDVLDECDISMFPNIRTLLEILATLPISVATGERSFSTLRRLKTWLRSNMLQDRLVGLALLHIHRDIECDVENVIDRFAKSSSRKLDFVI